MKKNYITSNLDITSFEDCDVITASPVKPAATSDDNLLEEDLL